MTSPSEIDQSYLSTALRQLSKICPDKDIVKRFVYLDVPLINRLFICPIVQVGRGTKSDAKVGGLHIICTKDSQNTNNDTGKSASERRRGLSN